MKGEEEEEEGFNNDTEFDNANELDVNDDIELVLNDTEDDDDKDDDDDDKEDVADNEP